MATVHIQRRIKIKGSRYVVYYKDPASGRNRYYRTYKKLKDAQGAANDLRALLDTGKMPQVEKAKRRLSALTFIMAGEALAARYGDLLLDGDLAKVTHDEYLLRIRQATGHFGEQLLAQIQKEDLLAYKRLLAKEVSRISSNRIMFVVKQVFRLGLAQGAIAEDPSAGIPCYSEREYQRNRYLLPHEIPRLIAASQKTKAKYYLPALIYLGVEHGASKQEALSLKWSDIRFDAEAGGLIRFYRTKNRRERTENLMPQSRKALLDWREHQARMRERHRVEVAGSDLVFCHLDGTPILRFDTAWRRIRREAGFEGLHFHDLRHTFCSNARLAGADLADIKDMIGHSDLSMTNRYAHLASGRRRIVQEALARHYAEGVGSNRDEQAGNT